MEPSPVSAHVLGRCGCRTAPRWFALMQSDGCVINMRDLCGPTCMDPELWELSGSEGLSPLQPCAPCCSLRRHRTLEHTGLENVAEDGAG